MAGERDRDTRYPPPAALPTTTAAASYPPSLFTYVHLFAPRPWVCYLANFIENLWLLAVSVLLNVGHKEGHP